MSSEVGTLRPQLPTPGLDNYRTWAIALSTYLKAKKLRSIVSGTRQPITRPNGAPDEAFETDDATIRITIIGSIDPTQQQHVIGLESAKDQWETLRNIHDGPSNNRVLALLRQFYNFKAGNRKAAKPPELSKIMMLIDSLGPAFDVTKKILSATEDLTYAKALARLKEEELV
ncbi:MAG: hypothetical protein M1816_007033 [Peltula sp. TS41687]|nr:MAG: hypothetical protein M1816_007033 [Peltula sp. TS41687]